MTEIYPMPSFPLLAVSNIAASTAWYRDVLGFAVVFVMPGQPVASLVHLRWTKYADLLLRPSTDLRGPPGVGVTLNFSVAEDIDGLAAKARARGARILAGPADRPWNVRDFSVADPDGYHLTFVMGPLDRDLTIGDIVEWADRQERP